MEKQKPLAKPQPKTEDDILSQMDLDTVLKHAAEGKKDIAAGRWYSPEQSLAIILSKGKK